MEKFSKKRIKQKVWSTLIGSKDVGATNLPRMEGKFFAQKK